MRTSRSRRLRWVEPAASGLRPARQPLDQWSTALRRKAVAPGIPQDRRSSPSLVLPPRRCDKGSFRRLDLRLAVGDSDGGPGDRGGDVRSCRPECGGECREHAPDKAKLRWHTERTVRGASNARTHANGARHTDTVVERERSCLVAHDVSGVATWRGVRTRYRRRSSWTSDGQACHADPSGCHSPEPRAAGLPSGRRPLYEYRIVPAFAQARFERPVSGQTLSPESYYVPSVTTGVALQYPACLRLHH